MTSSRSPAPRHAFSRIRTQTPQKNHRSPHGGGQAPPPGAPVRPRGRERPPGGAGQAVAPRVGAGVAGGAASGAAALGVVPGPAAFRGPPGFGGAPAAPGAQRREIPEQLPAAVPGTRPLLPGHVPAASGGRRGLRGRHHRRPAAGPGGATGATGPGADPRPSAGGGWGGLPAPLLAGGGGGRRLLGAGSRPGVFGVARGFSAAGAPRDPRAADGACVTPPPELFGTPKST